MEAGTVGVFRGLLDGPFRWLLWSGVTCPIGDKRLGGTATWGELLRTIGFAQAPGRFLVLGVVPGLDWTIQVVVAAFFGQFFLFEYA